MNFSSSFDTYNCYSVVQKKVAKQLLDGIEIEDGGRILEIGAGTGNLTKLISKEIPHSNLILNDKFDSCRKYLEEYSENLIFEDMEKMELERYDHIFSSSVFQWAEDLDSLLRRISLSTERLIFSIYIEDNLKEINDHFGVSLDYHSADELKKMCSKYFKDVECFEKEYVLEFDSPREALRHLSKTGVTNIKKTSFSKIRSYSENRLTYRVAFLYCNR